MVSVHVVEKHEPSRHVASLAASGSGPQSMERLWAYI
jgi:hypothetical protein